MSQRVRRIFEDACSPEPGERFRASKDAAPLAEASPLGRAVRTFGRTLVTNALDGGYASSSYNADAGKTASGGTKPASVSPSSGAAPATPSATPGVSPVVRGGIQALGQLVGAGLGVNAKQWAPVNTALGKAVDAYGQARAANRAATPGTPSAEPVDPEAKSLTEDLFEGMRLYFGAEPIDPADADGVDSLVRDLGGALKRQPAAVKNFLIFSPPRFVFLLAFMAPLAKEADPASWPLSGKTAPFTGFDYAEFCAHVADALRAHPVPPPHDYPALPPTAGLPDLRALATVLGLPSLDLRTFLDTQSASLPGVQRTQHEAARRAYDALLQGVKPVVDDFHKAGLARAQGNYRMPSRRAVVFDASARALAELLDGKNLPGGTLTA
jgi:hypothetical protein